MSPMLGDLVRRKRVAALVAGVALLCQAVVAVPVAERMALDRARTTAPAHTEFMGAGGMGAHAAGKPAKPDHSKHEHQSCPFCATAALFGLSTPGFSAPDVFAWMAPRLAFPSALFLPAPSGRAHQSRAPPPPPSPATV